jgi:Rrf2 family protein
MAFITTKGVYGISALYELMGGYGMGPMQIKNISRTTGVPFNYLEQLLNQLRKAGIVESIRGAKGGYMLARRPEEIIIYDVLVALEGEMNFADYALENRVVELFFNHMQDGVEHLLTLPLSEFRRYQSMASENLNYSI